MTANPDPLAAVPEKIRAKMRAALGRLPHGWRMVNPRLSEDGAWAVDLVTADGRDAGAMIFMHDPEEA